ncbi:MAG: hypothetical protein J4473_00515 [Candidatus Aenigmarchaeota archaeon]|nr:hypothetical protein [Candidatus Aenigmarchaeota archaeon]
MSSSIRNISEKELKQIVHKYRDNIIKARDDDEKRSEESVIFIIGML